LPHYVNYFVDSANFTGPSLHFYEKATAIRSKCSNVGQLLNEPLFCEWVYATLTAWGMHRMGPGNTKLKPLETIMASLDQQSDKINDLWDLRLENITNDQVKSTAATLWQILDKLNVSIAATKIVANTKTLHHILPSLVAPIDRTYTLRFFYNSNTKLEAERFTEMFRGFHRIAVSAKDEIARLLGGQCAWNTSESKIIDNAIVGWVLENFPKAVEADVARGEA